MAIETEHLMIMRTKPGSLELSATISMIANERKLFKSKKRKGILTFCITFQQSHVFSGVYGAIYVRFLQFLLMLETADIDIEDSAGLLLLRKSKLSLSCVYICILSESQRIFHWKSFR